MNTNEHKWTQMDTNGHECTQVNTNEKSLREIFFDAVASYSVALGYTWVHLGAFGSIWVHFFTTKLSNYQTIKVSPQLAARHLFVGLNLSTLLIHPHKFVMHLRLDFL